MTFELDRMKYIRIAQEQGVSAALTALHNDYREWEFDTFEGPEGWKPDQYEALRKVRAFSRELWNINYGSSPVPKELEEQA
jgi:hypothetical protein